MLPSSRSPRAEETPCLYLPDALAQKASRVRREISGEAEIAGIDGMGFPSIVPGIAPLTRGCYGLLVAHWQQRFAGHLGRSKPTPRRSALRLVAVHSTDSTNAGHPRADTDRSARIAMDIAARHSQFAFAMPFLQSFAVTQFFGPYRTALGE